MTRLLIPAGAGASGLAVLRSPSHDPVGSSDAAESIPVDRRTASEVKSSRPGHGRSSADHDAQRLALESAVRLLGRVLRDLDCLDRALVELGLLAAVELLDEELGRAGAAIEEQPLAGQAFRGLG